MKRYLFIALLIPMFVQSEAAAQRDLFRQLGQELRNQGRQLIQQELGNRQQGLPRFGAPPQQGGGIRANGAIPSEGGGQSGGRSQDFIGGGDFQFQPSTQPDLARPIYRDGLPQQWQPQPNDWQFRDQTLPQGNINPQPRTFTQPGNQVYTQPTSTTVSSSSMPSSPVMSNRYATIRCPESVLGTIRYTLKSSRGSYSFTLGGGQEQRFRVDTPWSISYNDGSQQRRYAIRGGMTYTMKMTKENRWQLYSVKSPGS